MGVVVFGSGCLAAERGFERPSVPANRLTVQEDLLDAALAVEIEGIPVDDLAALVERHPVRERLRGQLIRTLLLVGRHADALTSYQAGVRALRDELDVPPGPELQAIWRRLVSEETTDEPAPVVRSVPRQLPPDIADFTGRATQVAEIAATLTWRPEPYGAVPASCVRSVSP